MSKKPFARRARRVFSSEFKAKVVLAAQPEYKTLSQLCQQYESHPNQIRNWKCQLLTRAAEIFGSGQLPHRSIWPDLPLILASRRWS